MIRAVFLVSGHLLILLGLVLILSGAIRLFKPKLPKITPEELAGILELKGQHDAHDPWVDHRDKECQS